jgi:2-hydroxychromene-2-carboxylate isomerase
MSIHFFFDFISPYSYLAGELLLRDEPLDRQLDYAPVVFGTFLARRNARGPGEDPRQREINLQDLLMRAQFLGIPFEGPPVHPFNPVMALRSVCALEDEADRRRLTHAYFQAGWRDGQPLDDPATLRRVLASLGLEQDPEETLCSSAARQKLKKNTEFALEHGATGVPTFLSGDVVFFGGDRIDLLKAYLAGTVSLDREKLAAILARPGITRVV